MPIKTDTLDKNFSLEHHVPVMLPEVIQMLSPKDGGIYFDGTFGGGGYTRAILESSNCRVVATDRDAFVKNIADDFSKKYGERFSFASAKFSKIRSVLESFGLKKLDGLVLDLGVSNFQLSDPARGFSFKLRGPVDMTMGICDETAIDVIRKYSEKDLADIIYKFGDEHFSRRIAKTIKQNMWKIENTEDLANSIRKCLRKTGKTDPATKTFQALRIFVNRELEELQEILRESINLLNPGGKIIVVSFHSLEDRIVKFFFKELVQLENCEIFQFSAEKPMKPVAHSSQTPPLKKFRLLTKKPVSPSREEILSNPKSRSAKLRGIVAEM